MPWTRATHLQTWAETEFASRHLPLLVRRLIRATTSELKQLNIPSNEQTGRPGFDGIVECENGNEFVPAGLSVWEMGVGQEPKSKANTDIAKRKDALPDEERAIRTFVFVTPRSFQDKEDWAQEQAASGGWKNVKVLDNNTLEHWLEQAPGVDAWISQETRLIPSGVESLGHHWKSLYRLGANELVPGAFTRSRESEIQAVLDFLGRDPNSLFLQTSGLMDGTDFLAALAVEESARFLAAEAPRIEEQALSLLQNAILVSNVEEWRQLSRQDGPLLLIATPQLLLSASAVAGAVDAGHYVIVAGPRGISSDEKDLQLRGVEQYVLQEQLIECGYSEAEALSLSKASAGSTSILKRRLTSHPDTDLPAWAKPEEAIKLAGFALVGGWTHVAPAPPQPDVPPPFRIETPSDSLVLEHLGYTGNELDQLIGRWLAGPEPLFLKFGDQVLVASREDAWYLLGDYVTERQLAQFADIAILVLEEDNPALELDPDQWWMADLYGKRHAMSSEVRRSLVETIALMATCPTAGHSTPDQRFIATINKVLHAVLPANSSWKRWATLRGYLGIIAEAAPEFLLRRIVEDLESSSPALPQLFREPTGTFLKGWLHCELLWALETLAWSPDYLARVSLILAKLIPLITPTGNLGNRPDGSLREIYLLWLPHTNATAAERIAALRRVLEVEPAVGWRLLVSLLPNGVTSVSHGTSMPRWRDWADGWSGGKMAVGEYDYAMKVADLVLEQVALSPQKWADAMEGLLHFNQEISLKVLAQLEATADEYQSKSDEAIELWKVLRSTVQKHEDFLEAEWAFPKSWIDELASIRDRICPTDPVLKYLWLFGAHVELPGYRQTTDYDERRKNLQEARRDAAREIYDISGTDGVWRLLELGGDANCLGFITGKYGMVSPEEIELGPLLVSSKQATRLFASAYAITSYYDQGGWTWVESLNLETWSAEQRAYLALSLPFEPTVWDWVDMQGSDVSRHYWETTGVWSRDMDVATIRRAVDQLLAAGRPFSAAELVSFQNQVSVPSELLADVLDAGLTGKSIENPREMRDVRHSLQELIGRLQTDPDFNRSRLARIEWGYLPILERDFSETQPETLIAAIKEQPSIFVELIRMVYRGNEESEHEPADMEHAEFHIQRSLDLLDHLRGLPGMSKDGTIDVDSLNNWVAEVLAISSQSGHERSAAYKLGQYVGRSIYPYLDSEKTLTGIGRVVEAIATEEMLRGIENGIVNSRGVTSRNPFEGGKLEYELAAKFAERAALVRNVGSKLCALLKSLEDDYKQRARREDEEAGRGRIGR